MASFDDVAKELVLYDQRVELREGEPVPVRGVGERIAFDPTEPLRLECEAFLRALITREPPLTDGESGLRVLRVLQAALPGGERRTRAAARRSGVVGV